MFRVSYSKKKKKGAKTTALLEKKFPLITRIDCSTHNT